SPTQFIPDTKINEGEVDTMKLPILQPPPEGLFRPLGPSLMPIPLPMQPYIQPSYPSPSSFPRYPSGPSNGYPLAPNYQSSFYPPYSVHQLPPRSSDFGCSSPSQSSCCGGQLFSPSGSICSPIMYKPCCDPCSDPCSSCSSSCSPCSSSCSSPCGSTQSQPIYYKPCPTSSSSCCNPCCRRRRKLSRVKRIAMMCAWRSRR
ncbi:hypothetical protein PFISCL1PPCAC_15417, partial [Pristionchus fissidentatus]